MKYVVRRKIVMIDKKKIIFKKYKIATAEILYHMPDYPDILQSYIWQELDIAPKFPVLNKFLVFWNDNIEGKLHSVRVASKSLTYPNEFRFAAAELNLQ